MGGKRYSLVDHIIPMLFAFAFGVCGLDLNRMLNIDQWRIFVVVSP